MTFSDADRERLSLVPPDTEDTCPTCNRCGNRTDYRRGRYGLCAICDDADWQKRSQAYEDHPAKGRRRPLVALRAPRTPVPDLVGMVEAQERRRAYTDAHMDDEDDTRNGGFLGVAE
jgi:hypothetical protein